MKTFLNQISKNFLLNEMKARNPRAYLQSLQDVVEQIRPSSKKDSNRLQLAKEHISSLKRQFRKLQEQVNTLEEQLKVLEESKGKK